MTKTFISGLVESSIDTKVYQDLIRTYAKETISFVDYGNLSITNIDPDVITRAQFTECEISPFHHNEIHCQASEQASFARQGSTRLFSQKKIDFADLQNLLVHSFSPSHSGQRPYPSAGGLYPVEPLVFMFAEKITSPIDFASGCYHFRPISKKLQLIKKIESSFFFEKLLHGFVSHEHEPCFCILYTAHIGKAIFKYRYRGYRHALMEAGSMYQQAVHISQKIGLSNTVWSTFSEQQMLYELGLDHGTYMPLTMQLFGYGEEK